VRVTVPRRPASSVDAVALCLEPHDLILAKLVANRQRDWEFARDALAAGLVNGDVLRVRVADLPVADDLLRLISDSLGALLAGDAGWVSP
jgi:hypothetical protein